MSNKLNKIQKNAEKYDMNQTMTMTRGEFRQRIIDVQNKCWQEYDKEINKLIKDYNDKLFENSINIVNTMTIHAIFELALILGIMDEKYKKIEDQNFIQKKELVQKFGKEMYANIEQYLKLKKPIKEFKKLEKAIKDILEIEL